MSMHRLLTTVTLAAWLGYCAVSAVTCSAAAFAEALAADAGTAATWLPHFIAVEASATALLAGAGLFALALVLLHGPPARHARGEWLGLAAIVLATVMLLCGAAPHAAPAVPATTVLMMLVASVLAIAVDRLITVEEDKEEDDLASFEAGIAAVAQAMARQTQLYTPPRDGQTRR